MPSHPRPGPSGGPRDCAAPPPAPFAPPASFTHEAAGQRFAFFPGGEDRREALIAMLRGATTSLKLAFYIFAEDQVSTAVRDELVAAARRGVRVVLLIDRFGADASDAFLEPIVAAGGIHRCFSGRWTQRYLIRNHQKIVIADDCRAMFGGFNIEDDYFAPPSANGWNDLAITIEGSAVNGLVDWFARLEAWTARDHLHFADISRAVRAWDWRTEGPAGTGAAGAGPGDTPASRGSADTAGGTAMVRWLVGGPTRGLSSWARCLKQDMRRGTRLDVFMAYFSPPRRLLRVIGAIADRGEVRLVMAGKSDNGATIGASRALYAGLLRHGARIWEFTPCKLHTKLIVLDDIVYMGSANFDMRSLYLNLELMLKVKDAALADRMRGYIGAHIAASEEISPALHARRATLVNRLRWWAGWVLVSVVDYTVSRRLNLGM